MQRAVVLGSRFGGLALLTWLRRFFSPADLMVTVVDQWQEACFRPGLVHAMDRPSPTFLKRLNMPLGPFWKKHHIESVHDTIVGVDPDRQRVHTATHRPIPYDVLFIATGAVPRWEAIPGLDLHRSGICEAYLARHTWEVNQRSPGHQVVFAAGPIDASAGWRPAVHVGSADAGAADAR